MWRFPRHVGDYVSRSCHTEMETVLSLRIKANCLYQKNFKREHGGHGLIEEDPLDPELALKLANKAFSASAELQNKTSPCFKYPAPALNWLAKWLLKVTKDFRNLPPEFGHNADIHVCDLGAGDGKFLKDFLPVLEKQVHSHVDGEKDFVAKAVAVEPVPEMRRFFLQNMNESDNLKLMEGHAIKIPLKDESVHAIVAAQSFNWFPTVPALFEITRVLRPKGFLGIIFSVPDQNEATYIREIEQSIIQPLWQRHQECVVSETAVNKKGREKWKEVFDTFLGSYYGPLHEYEVKHIQWAKEEELVNMYLKVPVVSILEPNEIKNVTLKIRDVLNSDVSAKWRSNMNKEERLFKIPHITKCYWVMKLW